MVEVEYQRSSSAEKFLNLMTYFPDGLTNVDISEIWGSESWEVHVPLYLNCLIFYENEKLVIHYKKFDMIR
jgi:hypothetical protein